MSTATVTLVEHLEDGTPLVGAYITASLYPSTSNAFDPAKAGLSPPVKTVTDSTGSASLTLERTDTMTPSNMAYSIRVRAAQYAVDKTYLISVPAGGGVVRDLLVASPAAAPVLTSLVSDSGIPFGRSGALTVVTGQGRWYSNKARTIATVTASVGTAPTGAALIVDVKKNGVTIFTNPANRPTIAAATNFGTAPAIDIPAMAPNDYLTVDVAQVGSTTAGSDLTVQIFFA